LETWKLGNLKTPELGNSGTQELGTVKLVKRNDFV